MQRGEHVVGISIRQVDHAFFFAAPVALVSASALVFASSNVTTASAFSRLTLALLTPATFVNDLFTETAQPLQVMPDTASVIV